MGLLETIIVQYNQKKLADEGISLTRAEFRPLIREFYEKLSTFYSLSGEVTNMDFSCRFMAEAGSYFPSIEPNEVLLLSEDVRINIIQVESVKFWVSGLFLDFSFRMKNTSVIHITAQPVEDKKDELSEYLGLAPKK